MSRLLRRFAAVRLVRFVIVGVGAALLLFMETAPYVATIGACIALLFVADPSGEGRIARDFGLGFAGVSGLVFLTTIAPSAWGQPQCDAFSTVQFVVAALAGCGLAAVASLDMTFLIDIPVNGRFEPRVLIA